MPKAPWTYQSRNVSSFQVAENYFGPRLCLFHLQKAKHQAGHLSGGSYGRRHRTGLLHYSCAHGQRAPELLPAPSVPAENVASGSKDMPQKSISLESIHCSPNICSLPGRSNPSLKYFPIEGTQSKSSSKLFACTVRWLWKDTKQLCSCPKFCCIRKLGESWKVLEERAQIILILF